MTNDITNSEAHLKAAAKLHDLVCKCGDWPHCGALDLPEVEERYVYEDNRPHFPAGYVDTSCGKPVAWCDCDDYVLYDPDHGIGQDGLIERQRADAK